jgi:cell division protein FtsL
MAVLRLLSLLAFGFLAGLVILTYDMKFETRRLEARASQLLRAIQEEKDNVALMRAEWSHVTRPERVEKLAREILTLAPIKSSQLVYRQDFMAALSREPKSREPKSTASVSGWRVRDEIGALIRKSGGEGRNASHVAIQ